ncbi:hypothetical protein [Pseudaminobacter sp. NGMCC 1.201702]|uniref:hypothetical protein n=1 Tax=Pseudaminobacter sp. NGMCC 1.201702 TaxID=3391825 RepID=UPI0039EEDC20
MTIAERKAREAYDRENPWRPMAEAAPDGTVCELLFNDMVGSFDAGPNRYFLDLDGDWYRIDPPERVYTAPMNWRPAYVRLTIERRHYLKKQANTRRNA